jgi:hypothetical protein
MERLKLSINAITSSTPTDLILCVATPTVNNNNDIADNVSPITDESRLIKNAGRPKGTTCSAKANYNSIIKKAITDAAVLFDKLK